MNYGENQPGNRVLLGTGSLDPLSGGAYIGGAGTSCTSLKTVPGTPETEEAKRWLLFLCESSDSPARHPGDATSAERLCSSTVAMASEIGYRSVSCRGLHQNRNWFSHLAAKGSETFDCLLCLDCRRWHRRQNECGAQLNAEPVGSHMLACVQSAHLLWIWAKCWVPSFLSKLGTPKSSGLSSRPPVKWLFCGIQNSKGITHCWAKRHI